MNFSLFNCSISLNFCPPPPPCHVRTLYLQSIYVVHSYYLSQQVLYGNFTDISLYEAVAIVIVGTLMVYINYDADLQRGAVRRTDGTAKVWGKPAEIIRAKYTVEGSKDQKSSILLVSGWWGVARHFHYVPEILAAVCWTYSAGFNHVMPWIYVIFLTILLTDRAFRDDARCSEKYGSYWKQYCDKVKYKIIPGVI